MASPLPDGSGAGASGCTDESELAGNPAFVEQLHALKRIASPEEIARSVLYLASDASSFTTGTALLVDGGVSINRT